jgi:D-arabinono-1,4-lactone oxidase
MDNPHLQSELSKLDPAVPFRASTGHIHHTWAKTFHSLPELYIQPHTLEEIQKIVTLARKCRRRIVLVGSGHSPSDLTCTSSWMVNLDNYSDVLKTDREKRSLLVQSGIRLHALNTRANENGLTIPNMGSIDEQSIAGAIATATHGSSLYHGILSQWVLSLRIVLANGSAVRCSSTKNSDLFRAALVSLGALGIIVEVEFQMVPSTNIEWVQTLKSLDYVLDSWNTELWTQAEFTRVWWLPYLKRAIVWRAQKTRKETREPQSNWYGNAVGFHTYHTLLWISNYFPRILPTVEWFVFGMQYGFSTESSIDAVEPQRTGLLMNCLYSQFVNEWAMPLSKGPEAISRLSDWINGNEKASGIPFSAKGLWVHSPIEVRVADTSKHAGQTRPFLDTSCKEEPTLFLNATLYRPYGRDPPCMERYYEAFEWLMKEMGAKPHWAKNFAFTAREDFEHMYGDDLISWRRIRREVDPDGVFVGDWLRRNILEAPGKDGELLACEETEVSIRKRGSGGVDWLGRQAVELSMAGPTRPRSAGSSEESFDHLAGAEAEASTLFEGTSEDGGSPVEDGDGLFVSQRVRDGNSRSRPFDKM